MVKMRPLMAVVCALSSVAMLSGCNRNYEILGPYSLGFDGTHLVIGVCEDMTISGVRLSQTTGARRADDTRVVWTAVGDLHARSGDTMIVAGQNSGLRNSIALDDVNPVPGSRFDLGLNDISEASLSAAFEIPDDGLAPGAWLTPLGEIRDTPCEPDDPTVGE
ncbi:hypothetical protein [Agromyces sp. PvR057]|uniref:hypothetical protein n=1 Tax=Agromyces sp. PvR057 TaxID=3156403 RepID=UPI0033932CB6